MYRIFPWRVHAPVNHRRHRGVPVSIDVVGVTSARPTIYGVGRGLFGFLTRENNLMNKVEETAAIRPQTHNLVTKSDQIDTHSG